jgi:Ca2+-binding EF-hand superfamily protein
VLTDAEKDIVEIAMKKLDTNRDGQITFDDFVAACKSE